MKQRLKYPEVRAQLRNVSPRDVEAVAFFVGQLSLPFDESCRVARVNDATREALARAFDERKAVAP